MTGNNLEFVDVTDGPVKIGATPGDIDKEFRFTLPENLVQDDTAILSLMVASGTGITTGAPARLSVDINGQKVTPNLIEVIPTRRSVHEVMRGRLMPERPVPPNVVTLAIV